MNKMAVFVEGYTEIVFIEKLIEEIAGRNKVLIDIKKIRGGSHVTRTLSTIKASKPQTGEEYYVLLYDCGGDNQVKSRILEEHENLTQDGYSKVIGIRDVRPIPYNDIPKLEAGLRLYIKTKLAPVTFILSVMEIEAWFLAETTHFARIEPSITVSAIKANLGFDPENDNLELRPCPADDLNACYELGGITYQKHDTKKTADALDYAFIYMSLRSKINYLDRLITAVDAFLE